MTSFPNPIFTGKHAITAIIVLLFVADMVGFTEYRIHSLLGNNTASTQVAKIEKEGLEQRISKLEEEIEVIRTQNEEVLGKTTDLQKDIEDQIGDLSGTVSDLNKLAQTDPELLQKYSKTYFLNEHYVPTEITGINPQFTLVDKILQIHVGVYPHLEDLLRDAQDAGLNLGVVSAYRPFGEQATLKASYTFTYGAGTANQFSAEQGYSEHQLGTTVDFAVPSTAATLEGFNLTPEYAWLVKNAQKYGFILSYPQTNVYYKYEPWHWRFVGVDLAKRLYNEGRYFYDYDQREINNYLGRIFD
jgi:LAS superfamily LD-carboxypeptidase LdcB